MSDTERGPAIFAGPFYFVAFLLIIIPLIDFIPNVWPLRFGEVGWRYGALGLFSNYTMTPVLGFVVLAAAAAGMGHQLPLRISGWVLIVIALLLLASTMLFALDALQIRSTVDPQGRTLLEVGAARAVVKNILVMAGITWLGIAAIRFRPIRRAGER